MNAAICVGEAVAGFRVNSLSLVMDGIHNLSDEFALALLYLAFLLPHEPSRHFVRLANLFNSLGLLAVSGLLGYRAVLRLISPTEIVGTVPIIVGILAATGNLIVAKLLRKPARTNAPIRLAYVHNMGDVWVSLAPAGAGLLVLLFRHSVFDALCAILIAGFFIFSTLKEVIASREELIWPGRMTCVHGGAGEERG